MDLREKFRGEFRASSFLAAYRRWLSRPSRAGREEVLTLAIPLAGKMASTLRALPRDDRDDLEQELLIELDEILFRKVPARKELRALASKDDEFIFYLERALWNRSRRWADMEQRYRSRVYDFAWACVHPPHAVRDNPADVLPRLYEEEVRRYAVRYAERRNRFRGDMGRKVRREIARLSKGDGVRPVDRRDRFVHDYATVLLRLGMEELRTKGG
jgi:hypothetical protein